jgi:uncharacterized iron-regulated protein
LPDAATARCRHDVAMKHSTHPALTRALLLALVAGCATACAPGRHGTAAIDTHAITSDPQARLNQSVRSRPLVLLGEVHDNATQHALRAEAWRALLASGSRPALLMEQFDREHQSGIDRALAQPGATADQVIAAGQGTSPSGWDWTLYKPFIEAAIAHGVPVVAANVSRTDTRRVMAEGLAALGFDATAPEALLDAHAHDIEQSHCGLIDLAQARRMAVAQLARDQFMARLLTLHAARGAVLLAGNGHVRRDTGVARWLPPDLASRSVSIGLLEQGEASPGEYDVRITTEPARRADPCEGLRNATPT